MAYWYRPHRGGLSDSMAEAKSFDSFDGAMVYAASFGVDPDGQILYTVSDLDVSGDGIFDPRTGWHNCRYIVSRRYGDYFIRHVVGTIGEMA